MAAASSLIATTRRRLEDETDAAYGDSLLLDALNGGSKVFATATGCCTHSKTATADGSNFYIALTTGVMTYRVLNVYAVEFNGVPLDWAPLYEARKWEPESGTPTGWSAWDNAGTMRLYFDTIPPATVNAVTVWFTYVPDDLTATGDTVGVPEKWHPALIAYMRYCIHERNRDAGLGGNAYAEFASLVQAAAQTNKALQEGGGYS